MNGSYSISPKYFYKTNKKKISIVHIKAFNDYWPIQNQFWSKSNSSRNKSSIFIYLCKKFFLYFNFNDNILTTIILIIIIIIEKAFFSAFIFIYFSLSHSNLILYDFYIIIKIIIKTIIIKDYINILKTWYSFTTNTLTHTLNTHCCSKILNLYYTNKWMVALEEISRIKKCNIRT